MNVVINVLLKVFCKTELTIISQKNFETVDDFAQSMIKGEFHMFDACKDDDEWVKAAERGDYENILMLKFEDIIGS